MELQWLNNSYVDLTAVTATLDFRWKRSVPSLRGTIITLHLDCALEPSGSASKCLRAKILGTWQADAVSVSTEPTVTVTSSQPKSPQTTTEATSSVTVTTTGSKSTANASLDEESSDLSKVFVALFSISLAVNVTFGIVVVFLWKKMQRLKNNNLRMKEIQNIDGQRRATTGDDIGAYDEVVTESGIHNDGIYDESFPSTTHNNNNGDHKYEEPSNYEPLRRNPLQDQSDEHNYQSLTTAQERN